ncbi:hypothetical protein GCM10011349_11570 [Novosphingobium indicum]|uniref:Uncharacterized protein n=1 Tax=Novosphingobium indicum TaxID=462949 RepID=A0ABQ2JID5_9SPHN|nr:hypothetical protein [Novosphingobium indicum]GGN45470.1 hypothetical protein GCM10011349_11570 [Novosphingobium indicum]
MKRAFLFVAALLMTGATTAQAETSDSSNQAPAASVTHLTAAEEQDLSSKLGQCFALKSTGEDRLTLAGWFVAALASAPQIAGVAKVESATKDKFDRQVAALFTRLMTKDCVEYARPLFRARSNAGVRAAGETLGRLAMQELMGDPNAAAQMMGGYLSYLHEEDFAAVVK